MRSCLTRVLGKFKMATCLVALPGAKRKVWKFFGFETDEKGTIVNKGRVKCRICDVSIGYSRNTTNLTYH